MATPESGYVVYDPFSPSVEYFFDKSVGGRGVDDVDITHNENRLELKTFGRFPYIYYAGETNYRIFDLKTVFIDDDNKNCRDQADDFKAMLMKRRPLVVKNTQGQFIVCDVVLSNESSPKLHALEDNLNYISITVRCTEIQDYLNKITIKHVGSGKGVTSATQYDPITQEDVVLNSATGGEGAQYDFTAIYGNPLKLKAVATQGEFISWTGLGNPITTEDYSLYSFANGITIEARFEELSDITVIHEGGSGTTTIIQGTKRLGRGVGGNGTNYQIKAIGEIPLQLKATPHIDNVFLGWRDEDGNMLEDEVVDFYDGMTLVAIFRELSSITIIHKGVGLGITSVTQNNTQLDTKHGGENTTYTVEVSNNGEPITLMASPDAGYIFVEWQDATTGGRITSPLNEVEGNKTIYAIFAIQSVAAGTDMDAKGGNEYHEQEHLLGSDGGLVVMDYSMYSLMPDRAEIWYNGAMVACTNEKQNHTTEEWKDASGNLHIDNGFVLSDGTLEFYYEPVNFNYTCKVIIKPKNSSSTSWKYTLNPPI